MKASLVILYYNAKDYIHILFPSIKAQTFQDMEVIVVDNGSLDGGLDIIKKSYPWVKTIRLEKNIGFSAGNNVGVKKASGEIVILVNDDTFLPEKLIEITVRKAEEKPAIYGGPYIYLHLKDVVKPSDIRSFFNEDVKAHMVSGSFMAIPRTILNDVGLLEESYFLYWEDLDFCYRAIQKGYDVIFSSDLIYYHKSGGSSNIRGISRRKLNLFRRIEFKEYLTIYYYYRNELLFALYNRNLFEVVKSFFVSFSRTCYHLLRFNKIPLKSLLKSYSYLISNWEDISKIRSSHKRRVSNRVINELQRNKDVHAKKIRAFMKRREKKEI